MKRNHRLTHPVDNHRQGSTLVIVIAMMGLLAFTGTVFYLFAAQERAAAEYFAESAKQIEDIPDDPFPFALRQMIVGTQPHEKFSILGDVTGAARHSFLRTMIGPDITPFTGLGVRIAYDAASLPIFDSDYDGLPDAGGVGNLLNMVDSIAVWGSAINESTLADARDYLGANAVPHPDVDFTTPDINTPFLAYKGFAIRDNGVGTTPRFEQVPVIIPSFFRPQYLKSGTANGAGGENVPTDFDWWDDSSVIHGGFPGRSYRPHTNHIGGFNNATGMSVDRFLDGNDPADAAAISSITAGPFPFRPSEGDNSADFGKLGLWTGNNPVDPTQFELDSDNDGDGIKEGIWLDLHYPILETTGGRFYATLHSFTIHDLDSLINLNIHGNLAGLGRGEAVNASILGGGGGLASRLLSRSHMGFGPNEINPLHAMRDRTAIVGAGDSRFRNWFDPGNIHPSVPLNTREMANMEWIWLLTGRFDTTVPLADAEIYEGRWGDANALIYHRNGAGAVTTLPRPGRPGNLASTTTATPSFGGSGGFDDNMDSLEGVANPATGTNRGFSHPLDYVGIGVNRQDAVFGMATPDFRLPAMLQDIPGRPESWLRYAGYSALGSVAATLNDSLYMPGRDGTYGTADDLSAAHFFDALFEDPLEMIVDLDFTLRPDDQMFSVQEMLIGHLTATDVTSAQSTPSDRLKNLMPITFADSSDRSERFTTISNSLRQVPFLQQPGGVRPWEWPDSDGDSLPEFPPNYGQTPYFPSDPFRPEVRRLLAIEAGEQQANIGQLPLSVNHILDTNRTAQTPPEGTFEYLAWIQRAGMRFRPLIEHPDGKEMSGGSKASQLVSALPAVAPAFPPQTFEDREFWARRDRQKLARDIYVLLYTLGGAEVTAGGTVLDYTVSNDSPLGVPRPLYTDERVRQMAQFAVNLVDAMDTDNVITQFEYDKDLGDGWNVDDNPSTDDGFPPLVPPDPTDSTNGLHPLDSGDRGVVFGVEAQQLAFSEVLAVNSPEFTGAIPDDPSTAHDDTTGQHSFLHVELQNVLPMPVDMTAAGTGSVDENQGVWRLARFDRSAATDAQNPIPNQTMTLMDDDTIEEVLTGGELFTIAMAGLDGSPGLADPSLFGTSDLYVDKDTDGDFDLISPDTAATELALGALPDPETDLDPNHINYVGKWLMTGSDAGQTGLFLDGMVPYDGNDDFGITAVPGAAGARDGFDLVLQRRLNPNLPQLPLADNPWVEVDRIKAEFKELFILGAGATLDLAGITSVERTEVLNGEELISSDDYDSASDPAPLAGRNNTIGSVINSLTSGAGGVFQLWQAHFDRDYASSGELLNLPIVGPGLLTRGLDRMRFAGLQQAQDDPRAVNIPPPAFPIVPGGTRPENITGAAGMFLYPDFQNAVAPPVPASLETVYDNRWYRLMQFVEVPSRVNRMLGNYLNLQRLPGKLNVNMIRHRDAYTGLIDDPAIASWRLLFDTNGDGALEGPFLGSTAPDGADATPGLTTGRDRWLEFINERDGYVDVGAVRAWLPGTPSGRPFRSMGHTTGVTNPAAGLTDNGMDETLLRRLGADLPAGASVNRFGEGGIDPLNIPNVSKNRHWLEPGNQAFHSNPAVGTNTTANMVHRHQFLSKIMNNTTTVSNCFIVYGTAAYFEAIPDPNGSGVFRVGGRMGLDLDGDSDERNDAGWERRAVFVIDRTELFNAYDPASGEFEWERLVKARLDLASDGQ